MSAEVSKPEYDSDEEDNEEWRASGKVCLHIRWQGDIATFIVRQTTAWRKVRQGAATKWGLELPRIKLLNDMGDTTVKNNNDNLTLKMSGLEAGKTYQMSVELEQYGGTIGLCPMTNDQ